MYDYDIPLKSFELSMDIARLPKAYSPNVMGGNSIAGPDSVEVIITRAKMIANYLKGK